MPLSNNPDDEKLIKVISFNMRRDGLFSKKNSWDKRKHLATDLIKGSGATIIGVQELLPTMKEDLKKGLDGYSIFGMGRCTGSKTEHSDIIIKDTDIVVEQHNTFWLSKRPEKVGSRGFLAMFPRICTVADVTIVPLNRKIRVYNTHFDHVSSFARNISADIILRYIHNITKKEPLPTIIMGDLNAKPSAKAIKKFTQGTVYEGQVFKNVFDCVDPATLGGYMNTHHGFRGTKADSQRKQPIDYIFVSPDFDVVSAKILRDTVNGKYPSDHYPVIAVLKLR